MFRAFLALSLSLPSLLPSKQNISFSMAVEARHLHPFPSQLLPNREIISAIETNANLYNTQIGFNIPMPVPQTLMPFYASALPDPIPATTTNAADSGLTCNLPAPRKRLREFTFNNCNTSIQLNTNNPFLAVSEHKDRSQAHPFSFLGEDISLQIEQQQLEIDGYIAQHAEEVRMELQERRRQQSKRIIAAMEERIMKRLKAKEEEIEKIGKLNWALEEKVKSLCIENQIWRDLAQSNEATAVALRNNLELVISQGKTDPAHQTPDDAESFCDSTDREEEQRNLAPALDNKVAQDKAAGGTSRGCRNCGMGEACVLLLPCRHLCLCTACGTCVHTCPVCKSNKNASVHVNMS